MSIGTPGEDNFSSISNAIADLGNYPRRLQRPLIFFLCGHTTIFPTAFWLRPAASFLQALFPLAHFLPRWLYTSSTLLCCLTHDCFRNISCIYDGMISNVARIAGWESIELIRGEMGAKILLHITKTGGRSQELTGRYTVTSSWDIDRQLNN